MDRDCSMSDSHCAHVSHAATTKSQQSLNQHSSSNHLEQYDSILHAIDHDSTILTPNRRLAATLKERHKEIKLNNGELCWESPDILPLNSWLKRLWDDYIATSEDNSPCLLTGAQEQNIWQSVVSNAKDNDFILQINETAAIAQAAWALLRQWQIPLDDPELLVTADYRCMQKWAEAFQWQLSKYNWIDSASLPELLGKLISEKKIKPAEKIILVGFTELTPQLKALLEAHVDGNIQQIAIDKNNPCCISSVEFQTSEAELYTVARWAKYISIENKNAKIACIIPDLEQKRDRIEQIFTNVFRYPDSVEEITFNISAGKMLSVYPIIDTALTLLAMYKNTIPVSVFNQILASPFVGDAETEMLNRAKYDSYLRSENLLELPSSGLLAENNEDKLKLNRTIPLLAKRLKSTYAYLKSLKSEYTHEEWSQKFSWILNLMGWPGERSLNSIEYQVASRWNDLLDEFSQLDLLASKIPINIALEKLHHLASNTVFQAQSPESNIQVLGILEAAGIPFDYVWVTGIDDTTWPPLAKPNPFIPKKIQRELNMPHATAERELQYCRAIMQQLESHSKEINYSYAQLKEDVECQQSPLTQHYQSQQISRLSLSDYLPAWESIFTQRHVECIYDQIGPPVTEDIQKGGVSLIKNQAICPFKAFAEHRLQVSQIETPLPGLRPKDRGNIVHLVMEKIWAQLRSQENLLNLSEDKLDQLINSIISDILRNSKNVNLSKNAIIQLEHNRLKKLIFNWLEVEKERNPFTVSSTEKATEITLGKLTLKCKIDRIDIVDNDYKMVIDYKTGKENDYKLWFGERIEEPQLPIYALSDSEVKVISYAQLHAAKTKLIGVSSNDIEEKGILPLDKVKSSEAASWEAQRDEWLKELVKISDSFSAGHAFVDPKSPVKSCQWCHLQPLCRIQETISNE